jgi:hypothetical protein
MGLKTLHPHHVDLQALSPVTFDQLNRLRIKPTQKSREISHIAPDP